MPEVVQVLSRAKIELFLTLFGCAAPLFISERWKLRAAEASLAQHRSSNRRKRLLRRIQQCWFPSGIQKLLLDEMGIQG
eukprot:14129746-Ditylum_brightwellii.AAC.1